MAKSKKSKVVDDEDLPEETDAEEEAVEEEVDVEEEPVEEEVAVEEEEAAPPDDDEPARDDDGDEEEEEPAPPAPKARLTKTQIAFILLNWLAVPAFFYFAYLDHTVHLQYAYRTLLNYVAIDGLPLREEEDFPSASIETRPRMRLTPEQLSEVFKERKGVNRGVPLGAGFVSVDEARQYLLRPSDMSEQVLKDVYLGQGPYSATLEDEIESLKKIVPAKIKEAADAVAAKYKTEDEKRAAARKILLPLAWDVWQVKKLDGEITSAKDAALDTLLGDSVQRRIYYDILAPVAAFQPGDLKSTRVERISDLDPDAMKALLIERLDASIAAQYLPATHYGELWGQKKTSPDAMNRDSIEKRSKIGFIMFTLGQVQVPQEKDKKLFPKGVERAQAVCGVYEFTNASIHYVSTLRDIEDKVARRIEADRIGFLVKAKEAAALTHTDGQVDVHQQMVDKLVKIAADIEAAQKRYKELTTQRDHFQKLYEQRAQQHKDTVAKMLAERKTTEKYAQELREYQETLFRALRELSDAAERNRMLEARIRQIETEYMNKSKKGGKKQP